MPQLSNEVVAAIIGGLVGAILGFIFALTQSFFAQRRRRKGVCTMLCNEMQINVTELKKWVSVETRPVRSNYLWDALKIEAGELLDDHQLTALCEFYYAEAVVYKKYGNSVPPRKEWNDLLDKGRAALRVLS